MVSVCGNMRQAADMGRQHRPLQRQTRNLVNLRPNHLERRCQKTERNETNCQFSFSDLGHVIEDAAGADLAALVGFARGHDLGAVLGDDVAD